MSFILIRVEVTLFWSAATRRRFPMAQTSLRTPYKNMFQCSTGEREIINHSNVAFIPDL